MKRANAVVLVGILTAALITLGAIDVVLHRQITALKSNPSSPLLTSANPSGHLALKFDPAISPNVQQTIRTKVLPALTKLIGAPWTNLRVWIRVDPNLNAQAETDVFDCLPGSSSGTITTRDGDYLPWLVHELAHAYHGCELLNQTSLSVEEGNAEAAKLLVLHNLHLPDQPAKNPNCPADINYADSSNNRAGTGGGQNGKASANANWSCLKEHLAGIALADAEKQHPGFLAKWNQALYRKLRRFGRPNGGVVAFDPIAAGDQVWSNFGRYIATQHVFDPQTFGDQIRIIAYRDSFALVGVKRGESNNETNWKGLQIFVSVRQEGRVKIKGIATLDQTGTAILNLANNQLNPRLPLSIIAKAGGLRDSLTYTPIT